MKSTRAVPLLLVALGLCAAVTEAFSAAVVALRQNSPSVLSATSQDTSEVIESSTSSKKVKEEGNSENNVPYIEARGDGSTGGGGLPMPNADDGDDGLTRPKVGAEMPEG